MNQVQPTAIQIHLRTGHKHMFYQDDPALVTSICEDLDRQIFSRASLILESNSHITTFPGHALLGITVLTDPLPESFVRREQAAKSVVNQISLEIYQYRRLQTWPKTEGERLFLEANSFAASELGERTAMHNLFTKPSLSCRRPEGGFSIWNTAHLVSWSHYPKLDVPANAWSADSLAQPLPVDARLEEEPVGAGWL